jgi:hypothetical protein
MSVTFIDSLKTLAYHNGVLRIDCIVAGPNGEERPSGTLLIPGNQAAQVLKALVSATQELDKRLREQQQAAQQQPPTGNA